MKNTLANSMLATLDVTRVVLRKKPAGTRGSAAVRSRTTNAAAARPPTSSDTQTCGLPHGWLPAEMNPNTTPLNPTVPSTAPVTSAWRRPSGRAARLSATRRLTAMTEKTATGTLT